MIAEAGTSEKLRILQTLFRAGYQSDVISQTLDKLIALEQERARRELTQLVTVQTPHPNPPPQGGREFLQNSSLAYSPSP